MIFLNFWSFYSISPPCQKIRATPMLIPIHLLKKYSFLSTHKFLGDGGNAIYYKTCCGTDDGACCSRPQAWFIILLVLITLVIILSVGAIFFIRRRMVKR